MSLQRVFFCFWLAGCAVAVAQSTPGTYEIVSSDRIDTWFTPWSADDVAQNDWNPLSRTAFGVRRVGQTLPAGARVAIFGRAVVSPASQEMIDAYWPSADIDLAALPGAPLAVPSNCVLHAASAPVEVAPARMTELAALCAAGGAAPTAIPPSVSAYTVAMQPAVNAAFGGAGAGWPAVQSGWAVPSFNSTTWTPAYDGRYANMTTVPGGQLHTFNLPRLAERLILAQSGDQEAALAFIRSTLLGTVFENSVALRLQACVILPPQTTNQGPRYSVIVTDVFEVYVHLIPGDGEGSENSAYFGCETETDVRNSLTTQAGLILDAGVGGPVVFALGVGSLPTEVRFNAGGCAEAVGVALNPLYPADPYCGYWLVFRPPGVAGPLSRISVLPPFEATAPAGDHEELPVVPYTVPVGVLPPRADAAPLFDCPPNWWGLVAELPLYL